MYAATPRVLITRWLDGAPLSALLDGRTDLLPEGWRELDGRDAADLAARLLGHAIYAPAACTGWMHADLHPGNFLLLPGGRLGMLDFGAVAATPGGIPAPFGQLAAAVLAADGPAAIRLARQAGALAPDAEVDPRLIIELLHPLAATGADTSFTYSRAWLRGLMAHLTAATLRPGTAQPDPAAAVRPALAGNALRRRALRAARRHRAHPRLPPGLLPRIPRQHPPGPAPANRRHTPPRQLNNRHSQAHAEAASCRLLRRPVLGDPDQRIPDRRLTMKPPRETPGNDPEIR